MVFVETDTDDVCVKTISVLAADMVQHAGCGHPGAAMGCAPMAQALWGHHLTCNPKDSEWPGRDRFVLSNGHACALQYAYLVMLGYEGMSMEDLKQFRRFGSKTPGHPENFATPGVEVCSGPLGQGISQAVGMAIAERHLASAFNQPEFELIDNYVYCICGDGCMQEGVVSEACSLAGHLKLGKLIVLYDDNSIQIDGETASCFTENVEKRFESYGWQTLQVSDGSSVASIREAIALSKNCTDRPSLISIQTIIGRGSMKEGSAATHGMPLGKEDLAHVKSKFGFNPDESFKIHEDASKAFKSMSQRCSAQYESWQHLFARYKDAHPELASEFERRLNGELPEGLLETLEADVSLAELRKGKGMATRVSSGKVLKKLGDLMPELIGGVADWTGSGGISDFAKITKLFQADEPSGRLIQFGVREHAMAAISNGMAAYGGVLPFTAMLLSFSQYALGAIRVGALSQFRVIHVLTHDSIFLGEDGPTHQPVEQLVTLRALPNCLVYRPADTLEVLACYESILTSHDGQSALSLSRQSVPELDGSSIEGTKRGGYIIKEGVTEPKLIFVSTGSEVHLCLEAARLVESRGIAVRVVSMPCQEIFDRQDFDYKMEVFPDGMPVLAVEAASPVGWARYSHAQVCMDGFGASGSGAECGDAFGFTPENVASRGVELVHWFQERGRLASSLMAMSALHQVPLSTKHVMRKKLGKALQIPHVCSVQSTILASSSSSNSVSSKNSDDASTDAESSDVETSSQRTESKDI